METDRFLVKFKLCMQAQLYIHLNGLHSGNRRADRNWSVFWPKLWPFRWCKIISSEVRATKKD